MPSIAENLARVQDSIAAACRHAHRPPGEVTLIAVSKTHPVECLMEAARAGHVPFGENRVQEFAGKRTALEASGYSVALTPAVPGAAALDIHLIGHLQSNKAARAVELFTSVDTLDSVKLAERLNAAAAAGGRVLSVLLEIKLSREPTKEGMAPDSTELGLLLERLPDLTSLAPRGLMTVAPIDEDSEVARACFRSLRLMRDELGQRHPRLQLETLSMGMSGDFAVAIEEGSTEVRIGTAIFGARPKLI